MLHHLRNNIAIRCLWAFMGLYFLNISVDTVDAYPNHIPEDLSFNDQESIVEIVLEQVLGYENAIAEYDDNDTEDHTKKGNFKIDLVPLEVSENHQNESWANHLKHNAFNADNNLSIGYYQLNNPPPEV